MTNSKYILNNNKYLKKKYNIKKKHKFAIVDKVKIPLPSSAGHVIDNVISNAGKLKLLSMLSVLSAD